VGTGTTTPPSTSPTTPKTVETDDDADDDDGELDEGDVDEVESDGVLNLGYILPESGPLAFLGPPQIQAVEMAVNEINENGGVLGNDVTLASG
jgi:ABC-type branched-subunit amino acid transport system substrate-binding protein